MNKSNSPHNKRPADLAGTRYWNSIWDRENSKHVDLRSYYDFRLSRYFHQLIKPGSRVLEVGCGGSVWLPYFAKYLQCEVWGIDYSESGVALALSNLAVEDVSGKVVLGDVFDDHEIPQGHFDILWSCGFVEHFSDPQFVVRKLSKFLKPGGIMITLVPNLEGFVGWLHKVVDREVYEAHIKIDRKMLDAIHSNAGLEVVMSAQYLGVFSIGVVNFNRFRARLPRYFDAIFWLGVLSIQQGICLPFRVLDFHPETKLFSPWIIGAYRLPFSAE